MEIDTQKTNNKKTTIELFGMKPLIIAIAGGSGSGKTTLARGLQRI